MKQISDKLLSKIAANLKRAGKKENPLLSKYKRAYSGTLQQVEELLNEPEPYTEKTLVLSTAHITGKVNDLLILLQPKDVQDENEPDKFLLRYVAGHHYGFVIFLLDLVIGSGVYKEIKLKTPSLYQVIEYALNHGCTMINLDRDAPTIPDLPVYNW